MFGELPAWGFYVRHAQGIEFRNLRLSLKEADFRPAVVLDDVRGLHLNRVHTGPISGAPVIVLNDVPEADLGEIVYPNDSSERLRLMGSSSLAKRSHASSNTSE
jgi:hypothetical protein